MFLFTKTNACAFLFFSVLSSDLSQRIGITMPFFDVQKRLGLNLDHWMTIQSAEQPHKIPGRCHAFEKEWIECAHGIGGIRAEKECKIEFDDFVECLLRHKTMKRLSAIRRQRDKLIKEGKYTPPPHHLGKEDPRP
uniref:NADH dehydrogenase [ubiquinone] iron-sulfur protein 5 n=1 Tax=Equus asinus TaxID=9793 RepID=A0A9L0INL4_EQUAS